MKFSMWIVNDWLEQFHPEPRITKGEMVIKGVRYFSEGIELSEDLLYVGHATDFIPTRKNGVICANGEDLILLDLEDVYTAFNEIQRMLEFYNEWEMGIMRAIDEGAEITEILESTLPVIDTTLLVTDASHSPLGIVRHPNETEPFQTEDGHISSADIIAINETLQKFTDIHEPYVTQTGTDIKSILRNFYAKNGDLIGWFVAMEGGERHVQSNLQLVEAFCHLLDFWFKINESALLLSPQSALFIDILEGKESDPGTIRFKQEGIGWQGDPELQLFCISDSSLTQLDLQFLQKALSSTFSAIYCFKYLASVLVIVNYDKISKKDFSRLFSDTLRKRKVYCGGSYRFRDLQNLLTYYKQADLSCQYGETTPGTINFCEDYSLEYIRHQINENLTVQMLSPVSDTLKQYDAASGTEYYKTLGVYLLNERDQTRAADILCIHRNTLIYRIKKIESLIQTDLDDSRKRFSILMSYYINDPGFLPLVEQQKKGTHHGTRREKS